MSVSRIPNPNLPIMAVNADISTTIPAGKTSILQFPFPTELKNNWYAIAWYKSGASDATGRNSIMVCPAAFSATLGNTNFIAFNSTGSEWSGTIQLGYLLIPKSITTYEWESVN